MVADQQIAMVHQDYLLFSQLFPVRKIQTAAVKEGYSINKNSRLFVRHSRVNILLSALCTCLATPKDRSPRSANLSITA